MPKSILKDESKSNTGFQNTTVDAFQIMNYILENTQKFNPTIRSVTMIEKLIYENKEFDTKDQLYKKLPKGMQYPMFNFILEVLGKQNKIMFDKDGSFFWTGQSSSKLQQSLEEAIEY